MTEKDFDRISSLIERNEKEEILALNNEMERARVLDFSEIPKDLVTMNSRFRYINISDAREDTITLVYPQMSNLLEGKISVTAPLGTALLGLRTGEEIDWKFPDGKVKKLRVLEILYQPEASGDHHL